jgi:hypothetical protein
MFMAFSTPLSWEAVPSSLTFYSSTYCQATFSGQNFSLFYLGVYGDA